MGEEKMMIGPWNKKVTANTALVSSLSTIACLCLSLDVSVCDAQSVPRVSWGIFSRLSLTHSVTTCHCPPSGR